MRRYRLPPGLTAAELRSIVAYYHAHFSCWKVIRNDTLIREDGPVAQGITFERLSGGVYRPTGHIRVLVAPEEHWGFELTQRLQKNQQLNRRQDREFRDRTIAAIRAEFVPNVDRPLVAEEVLRLYEEKAYPSDPEAYSLAAFNAYLGHEDRAMYWCSRFTDLVNAIGRPWQDFDYKRRAFLDQLEKWLQAASAKEQLDRVLQEERCKWGLV